MMVQSFYSLSSAPFRKELDSKAFFPSQGFSEGLARLEYLKATRGIGIVVADAGTGKTSLLRRFAGSLNPSLFKAVYFPLSTVTVSDFYRGLAVGLGEEPKFRKVDLFGQIQQAILNLFHNQKITPVFILDEMQMASNQFLNDISLLFNFAMDSQNPFVLILIGLPHFLERLKLSHNQPLAQRVIMRYQMNPLSKEDVKGYMQHNLKLAGANYDIFSPQAVEAIASRSRGFPRLVNNMATNCLLYGCAKRLEVIDEEAVLAVASEAGL
jgi:type II secretory pathway predicted ATPase ExeA